MTTTTTTTTTRCSAAHPDDPTPCTRPHDAVRIVDTQDGETNGCEHHGARLLASLEDARAVEGSVPAAGARVTLAADTIRPFCWYTRALRSEPSQRSHAENRRRTT